MDTEIDSTDTSTGRQDTYHFSITPTNVPKIDTKYRKIVTSIPPENSIPIYGLTPGLAVHYAECCHPLPGERIVGIVNPGKGIDIHAIDCERLADLPEDRDNWIDVRWDLVPEAPGIYVGRIDTLVSNQPGSLSSLSSVIAKNMGNISNIRVTDRSADFFRFQVDVEVADLKHLSNIIAALRAAPDISLAERIRG